MSIKCKPYFKRKSFYQIAITFILVLLTSLFQNCGRRYLPDELGNSDLNSKNIVGAKLYSDNCALCHNSLDSTTVSDKSEDGIKNALLNQNQMKFISITPEEITQIAEALNATEDPTLKIRTISNVEESDELPGLVDDFNETNLHATDQGN